MQIIKYKKAYLLFSLVLLIPGMISLAVFGLKLSIDFTGGSVVVYEYVQPIKKEDLSGVFAQKGAQVETVSFEGANRVSVRAKPLDVAKNEEIKQELTGKFEGLQQLSFETVGPAIGQETTKKAFVALFWASLGILVYIAYAFRNVPKPYSSFRFGASAIIAMLHDALMVLGLFSLLGHFFGIEIDALFITAVLTVIGFSVHDTIVVFDRIRENLKKLPHSWSFDEIVNYSVVETLNRSISTSLTVLMTLLALFILGGATIKYFVLALLVGITSGTYSSIFTASPILVLWENWISRRGKK